MQSCCFKTNYKLTIFLIDLPKYTREKTLYFDHFKENCSYSQLITLIKITNK